MAMDDIHLEVEGHMESVTSLTVRPNGNQFASSSADGTIRIWDIQTTSCTRTLTPPGPYEGMDITGATGLSPAQVAALQTLGAISDGEIAAARQAGLTDSQIIEIVANVALNVMTNYTNRVADTAIDFPVVQLAAA